MNKFSKKSKIVFLCTKYSMKKGKQNAQFKSIFYQISVDNDLHIGEEFNEILFEDFVRQIGNISDVRWISWNIFFVDARATSSSWCGWQNNRFLRFPRSINVWRLTSVI